MARLDLSDISVIAGSRAAQAAVVAASEAAYNAAATAYDDMVTAIAGGFVPDPFQGTIITVPAALKKARDEAKRAFDRDARALAKLDADYAIQVTARASDAATQKANWATARTSYLTAIGEAETIVSDTLVPKLVEVVGHLDAMTSAVKAEDMTCH